MKHLILIGLILISSGVNAFEDLGDICLKIQNGTVTEEELDQAQTSLDQIAEFSDEQYEIQIEEYCKL